MAFKLITGKIKLFIVRNEERETSLQFGAPGRCILFEFYYVAQTYIFYFTISSNFFFFFDKNYFICIKLIFYLKWIVIQYRKFMTDLIRYVLCCFII